MKIIHYSIDDVILVFEQLTKVHPKSIFDISFFSFLRNLHLQYGVKVSCYCFYRRNNFSLKKCTRDYKDEFEENASWLRFGFHGYTGKENYETQPLSESIRQYNDFAYDIKEIVGEISIDFFPRIHTFKASKEFVKYLTCNDVLPVVGLLTADDNRVSYSLTSADDQKLRNYNYLERNGLLYLQTTQRFDTLKPFAINKLFANSGGQVILFTHEWLLNGPSNFKNRVKSLIIKLLMKTVCKYYVGKGYQFAFPMDIKFN